MPALAIIAALLGASLIAYALFMPPVARSQSNSAPLVGFAWSDTIGWISMHCSDLDACGSNAYGIIINSDGLLSGYAWSEHIGWISANTSDLSGCPSGACEARFSEGSLTGWLRALSPVGASESEHGGWDGWISLAGANYSITANDEGVFSGYAWGSDVVGWVSFNTAHSQVSTTYTECAAANICIDDDVYYRNQFCAETFVESCDYACSSGACVLPPAPSTTAGGALRVTPALVRPGDATRVRWEVQHATACQVTSAPSAGSWSGATGDYQSDPIAQITTFTLYCEGDGGELTQTATVRITPAWREI